MALWEYLGAGSWTTKLLLHLNGNANDSSWNSNNGTATNVSWVGGKLWSGSASFNGTTSNIASSYSPNITSAITFNFWYKTSANYSGGSWVMLWKFPWSWDNYWVWLNTSNQLTFFVWWSSNWSVSDTVTSNNWQWNMVTALYNWTNIQLYKNWVLIWQTASWTSSPTWNMSIWRFWDFNWFYFNWQIDECIIENRWWSVQEIKKYYTFAKWLYIL